MSRRLRFLLFSIVLLVAEVLIATVFRHLSFVRGSLGDVLATMLLYSIALTVRDFHRIRLASSVFLFACLVELAQYFHLARVLRLAPGSVAAIMIGDSFQLEDIACYLAGTVVVVLITRTWR